MPPPKQGFISYAHADHAAFARLSAHLGAVANLYGFTFWKDRQIRAGSDWDPTIRAAIDASDVLVCLVSNDFLASPYIFQHELPALVRAYKDRRALLVPVILRDCAWMGYFGSYLEVAPKDDRHNLRPVRRWRDPEEGYARAANAIGEAVADWFEIVPRSPFDPPAIPTTTGGGTP